MRRKSHYGFQLSDPWVERDASEWGELMCSGQMFNNNGRIGAAEKHTSHPPHPTVAAGNHRRAHGQTEPHI